MRMSMSMTSPVLHHRSRQTGLTLMELMVALAIGLFLTLGLFLMMGDTSRTFKIQDDYARMQESAVSSLRFLSDTLRHAGFYGLAASTLTLEPYTPSGSIAITPGADGCGNTLTSGIPLFGYDGLTKTSVTGALPCIQSANFQDGPVLIARVGIGLAVRDSDNDGDFSDESTPQGLTADSLFVQSDANFGYIFRWRDFPALVSSGLVKRLASGAQFPVFPYQMHVYYVRPCSRPTGAGASADAPTCRSSDDNARPIPTLVRQELNGLSMVERPLAEGVERIHLLYGVDTQPAPNGDGIADRYVADPLALGADGWTRVVAVRVALLVRSPTPIAGYDDRTKEYDLNGDGTADFSCQDLLGTDAFACNYKRILFSQLIQVRNVAFRRGA